MDLKEELAKKRKQLFLDISKIPGLGLQVLEQVGNCLHAYFENADKSALGYHHSLEGVNNAVEMLLDSGPVSDGYHTFDQLYAHRTALWIALCGKVQLLQHPDDRLFGQHVWRSKRHSDGELAYGGDWFLLGIGQAKNDQLTYHLPMAEWHTTTFARELKTAPEWDGHTSEDVLARLRTL